MANQKNAQELLKWGLQHTPDNGVDGSASVAQISADIEAGRRPDLSDPRLYEAIMGKSEAQMMQEELAVALDATRPLDDRCTALDNFEMLIETIDNANNITSMKMWTPLVELLSASEPRIQTAAAWIVGTAVQNNDKGQVAILAFSPLAPLLDLLRSDDTQTRSKAMYALSGLLKHNPAAVKQFQDMDGWSRLRGALLDPNITLRRKTAFLINTLLFQDPNVPGSSSRAANRSAEATTASTRSSTSTALTTTAVAPASSATAVAPSSSDPRGPGPAPLERGPETMLTGVAHPDVAVAVLESGLLRTLLSSLLPAGAAGVDDDDLPPAAGPDGDIEARADLDFAEKATRAILTFTAKLDDGQPGRTAVGLDDGIVRLLAALAADLRGAPLDPNAGFKARWDELSIERDAFEAFDSRVSTWTAA
ncbi:related to FES1 - Hsp70 nucleotide exchange factor [Pseudozyma flocculosa]|uniref:Related to FES1 - Hsp70 nucleotide exchange factor n=1 Tax=Pseudozyma flocculosa TaxID=84751 RepID=A0A5C3F571_9BASI|nr:related to FES1 - Hsp70 nucleotide exchange factor [Pseudozyma flocculosa]